MKSQHRRKGKHHNTTSQHSTKTWGLKVLLMLIIFIIMGIVVPMLMLRTRLG